MSEWLSKSWNGDRSAQMSTHHHLNGQHRSLCTASTGSDAQISRSGTAERILATLTGGGIAAHSLRRINATLRSASARAE